METGELGLWGGEEERHGGGGNDESRTGKIGGVWVMVVCGWVVPVCALGVIADTRASRVAWGDGPAWSWWWWLYGWTYTTILMASLGFIVWAMRRVRTMSLYHGGGVCGSLAASLTFEFAQ